MSKEKRIKAYLKSLHVQGQITELKNSKTYYNNQIIYRKRLLTLEAELERLEDVVNGKEVVETKKVTFTVNLPGKSVDDFDKNWNEEEFIQFLQREKYVIS